MNQDKSRGSGSRRSPASPSLPTNPPLSPKKEAKTDQKPAGGAFPIVGMGASAGGLEAFEKFFTHLPGDSGMAFILVSHLDPDHASMMAELVRRFTPMPVTEVTDGMRVEANRVYTIPPNRHLAMDQDLRVVSGNHAFYDFFQVSPEETAGRSIFGLGQGQWDIPELRRLLAEILPESTILRDFRVEQDFPGLGPRTMLLKARRMEHQGDGAQLILLALEDTTGKD